MEASELNRSSAVFFIYQALESKEQGESSWSVSVTVISRLISSMRRLCLHGLRPVQSSLEKRPDVSAQLVTARMAFSMRTHIHVCFNAVNRSISLGLVLNRTQTTDFEMQHYFHDCKAQESHPRLC